MRIYVFPVFLCFIALAFGTAATPLQALTSDSPIHVSACNPQQGGVAPAPAFVPAYYPRPPWYWRDAYGSRYYQRPIATSNPTLSIDYVNVTQRPIKAIEFGLVARGTLVAEARDVGTFSPGAEIKHQFGLNPNVFPISTALPRCVPLRVEYADGGKWTNPQLPALRRSL